MLRTVDEQDKERQQTRYDPFELALTVSYGQSMAQRLSNELLLQIFRHLLPKREDPPWAIQHDLDWLGGQGDVARCAVVCRAWRPAARDVLFCQPAVRLTPGNAFSFGCLIYGLGRRDYPDSKRPIKSMLFMFSSAEHLDLVTARATISFAVGALAPPASLFLDNVPPGLLLELHTPPFLHDEVAFETLGIRVVDAAAGFVLRYPPKISLPDMPSLRHLYLCGANCDDIFERPAFPLEQLETLAIQHCTLSPRALAALSHCTALGTLFVANVCFSDEMQAAFQWRPAVDGAWVGVFDLHTFVPDENTYDWRVRSAFCRPWRSRDDRLAPPRCLLRLGPEILHEQDEAPSRQAARFLPSCRLWSSSLDRWDAPTYVWPPFRAAAAKANASQIWSLMLELGLTGDTYLPSSHPQTELVYSISPFRSDRGARAVLDDHLSAIAGTRVQVALDHSWGEKLGSVMFTDVHLAFAPVAIGQTVRARREEGSVEPSSAQLGRLERWVGRLGEVEELIFVHNCRKL